MNSYEKSIDAIEEYGDIAIVPVGSLEQHGHHLPINTDIVITQEYANMLGRALNAFVLPCLPISTNREHMGKRGSVWMDPDTFYKMLQDIILSLQEQGFRRVVIVQGHGGVFVIPPLVRQLNATKNPELQVCKLELYSYASNFIEEGILEIENQLHADELETSVMLYLAPKTVDMSKAVDFMPQVPREYLNYGSIFNYCPNGVWGNAKCASKEKGEKVLQRGTELGGEYIKTIFSLIENKKKHGYSYF